MQIKSKKEKNYVAPRFMRGVQALKTTWIPRTSRGTTIFLPIFLFILTCVLTSCGFHMRGQMAFAPALKKLYIKTPSPYGELAHNLREYFKMSGVYLADSPEDATT